MRSFKDPDGATYAVAQERPAPEEGAEIIDLIQLPSGSRPRPFAEIEVEEVEQFRLLDCWEYQTCLSFAARVRWRSFSCKSCSRFQEAKDEEKRLNASITSIIRLR